MSDNDFDYGNDFLNEVAEFRMSRRRLLQTGAAALGAAAAGPLIFTTADADPEFKGNLPYSAHTSVKGDVLFWHHYGSPLRHGAIRLAIANFNRYYPHVRVKDVGFGFGGDWDKNKAAVAAGQGMPDVIVSDHPKLWNDAKHGVYEPVTDLMRRDHLSLSVYWPFIRARSEYKGNLYGLGWETDVRVLYWIRAMFIDNGLKPDKGPVTWDDLKTFAAKLDKKGDGPGGYSVITFDPLVHDGASLDSWVWTNRSDWQDKKQHPTINAARNVETAQWMKGWIDRYGGYQTHITLETSSNQDNAHDELGDQHVAFEVHTPSQQAVWEYYDLRFYTKSGQRIYPFMGVGLLPHAKGGKSHSLTGGFALSIPRNHHRSKGLRDAAWEFTKYMSLVGQSLFAERVLAMPSVINIGKHNATLNATPHWKLFMQALALGYASPPNYHDVSFPGDVVDSAQTSILKGEKSAKDALDAAQKQALVNITKPGGS